MKFARYELLRKIASGGMGEVFLAETPGVAGFVKPVALKRIYPHQSRDPSYRRLFIREAKTAARLAHPNIVQVLELGEHDGELFIAMEYVEGTDLWRLYQNANSVNQLTVRALAVIAFDVLEALDYAHNLRDEQGKSLDIVHQDISPQNVLIGQAGFVKLCDFGVAKVARATQTQTQKIHGKLAYMAPEQARGNRVDARTDIFGLGMTLYRAFALQNRFQNMSMTSVLAEVENPTIIPLRKAAPDILPQFADAVDRALSPDPSDRFASAREFRETIEDCLLMLGASAGRQDLKERVEITRPAQPPPGDTVLKTQVLPQQQQDISDRWTTLIVKEQELRGQPPDVHSATVVGSAPSWPGPAGPDLLDSDPTHLILSSRATTKAASPNGGTDSAGVGFDDSKADPSRLDPARAPTVVSKRWSTMTRADSRTVWAPIVSAVVAAAIVMGAIGYWAHQSPTPTPTGPEKHIVRAPPPDALETTRLPDVTASTDPSADGLPINTAAENDEAKSESPPRVHAATPDPPIRLRRSKRGGSSSAGSSPDTARTEPARKPRFGKLNLNAVPWARVTIDGQRLSKPTPLVNYRLEAGSHRILLEGPHGTSQRLQVEIQPNKTTTKIVRLE